MLTLPPPSALFLPPPLFAPKPKKPSTRKRPKKELRHKRDKVSAKEFIRDATNCGWYVLDLETIGKNRKEGLNPHLGKIQGFALKTKNVSTFLEVAPFGSYSMLKVVRKLQQLTSDPNLTMIGHNLKFDIQWLWKLGMEVSNKLCDTMVMSYLVKEDRQSMQVVKGEGASKYGLKKLVYQHFGHKMTAYSQQGSLFDQTLSEYALEDVNWTHRLWEYYKQDIEDEGLTELAEKIEMPLIYVLADMELTGVFIDPQRLRVTRDKLVKLRKKKEREIFRDVGHAFDLGKDHRCAEVLYDEVGLPMDDEERPVPIGKKGVPSTKKEVLELFEADYPIVRKILEWRHFSVLLSTFCHRLIKEAEKSPDGRVHGKFNQCGTKIGRLSCISDSTQLPVFLPESPDTPRLINPSELLSLGGSDVRITTHKGRKRRILHLINKGPGFMYDVETEDGKTIRCTKDHRFYTKQGWRALKDLHVGSRLLRGEVCEAAASSRRKALGAGSPLIPEDLRGRQESSPLEDTGLRSVQWNRPSLQGSLRLGVSSPVQGQPSEGAGLGGATPVVPHLRSVSKDEGLRPEQRVVQGVVRRQRPDSSRGQVGVWRISPEYDPRSEAVSGVRSGTSFQARQTHQRKQKEGADLLQQDGIVRGVSQWEDGRGDRRRTRGRLGAGAHGYAVTRHGAFGRQFDLVAHQTVTTGVGPAGSDQSGFLTDERDYSSADLLCDRGGVSTPAYTRRSSEAKFGEIGKVRRDQGPKERSPHLCVQQGRDAPLKSADCGRRRPLSTSVLLQELAGRLRLAGAEAHGRGRRGVAPEGRGHQGARQTQGEEGPAVGLQGDSIHYRGRLQEAADSSAINCISPWVRIAKITPVGVEDVWDIEVEEDHSYVAQGFVNHNSSRPNLQNIPRPTGKGDSYHDSIRGAFCAAPGNLLLGADYGQVELRLIAHLSGDPTLLEIYNSGGVCKRGKKGCDDYQDHKAGTRKLKCRHVDVHTATAEALSIPRAPIAKAVNFGACYRIGGRRLMSYAKIKTIDEARSILARWYETYAGIPAYHSHIEKVLKENAWTVESITGRKRRLLQDSKVNDFRAITQGIQHTVSASSQDLLKISMIRLYQAVKERAKTDPRYAEAHFVLQVHDELAMEAPAPIAEDALKLMVDTMEGADSGALSVRLEAEGSFGKRWTDCH